MSAANPMVPSATWDNDPWRPPDAAQKLLCWICVSQGVFEPPQHLVIAGGNSICLAHALPDGVVSPT